MTEKHRLAISRGLKALKIRRRRSAAMIASWERRRSETAPVVRNNTITPERFQADVEDNLVSQIIDLIDENKRYRALLDKIHNALK